MKKINLISCIIILLTGILACDKNNDSIYMGIENSWKLNDFEYSKDSSTQISLGSNESPFTVINIKSNIESDNGLFLACNLQITFNTSMTGSYIIKSGLTTVTNDKLNYMDVRCTFFTKDGAIIYDSIDTNITGTVIQIDDKYVVSILNKVKLVRVLNNDVIQGPETFSLICNKVR